MVIDLIGAVAGGLGWHFSSTPQPRHWVLFGLFLAAALGYTRLTKVAEGRRRADRLDRKRVEHIDLTSIWFGAAALVLPTTLALVLVVIVRAHRYRIARKPPGIWISTTATIVLAVVGVGAVRDLIDPATWLVDGAARDLATTGKVTAVVVAAGVVYFAAEAIPIGIYRGIRFCGPARSWTLYKTLGSRKDNLLEARTLLIAGVNAAAVVFLPPGLGLVLALGLAVRETRSIARDIAKQAEIEHLRAELAKATARAETDHLTGLYNRRGFEELADAALKVDHAAGHTSVLLMLDIDRFKWWNSEIGHDGGDKVLVAVADVLRKQTRNGDVVGRWGGEEDLVLLPDTTEREGREIANRIRVAVSQLRTQVRMPVGGKIEYLGSAAEQHEDGRKRGDLPKCTVSIGVAVAPAHGMTTTLEQLRQEADRALFVAKDAGRDRVVAYSELVKTPVPIHEPQDHTIVPNDAATLH
ncbi:GGDEF domain-containing protein [Amycolatopsis anabasis]|uniref:GGDEF domain-containing protein n=1 Tax=Amycolatopsis anabasis TaxID=1840409 RepID=UPI001FE85243|nr:GGDEF domain-containing protein [Amycolatopsis anabasis]